MTIQYNPLVALWRYNRIYACARIIVQNAKTILVFDQAYYFKDILKIFYSPNILELKMIYELLSVNIVIKNILRVIIK